ncbi:hypothetical protein SOV_37770 [Sporomusa ovata DSM 2662]|uniref:Uncharacterized protein n=1 Tax=Sporomusa ovata TaxID=2378 RepID=A0A0U1KS34_9FIRM|nr:hypothetical protein [Sporomusa ovata]EQB26166.1 hypothetical protein SOV_3c00400 [Sporomusa ovata DSM 2662]CQR70240.1 hypothetical protein SpAn4DRAFT_1209 [Sporomusa ovata]
MNMRYQDFKKQESELYDKIWELSEELDRLDKEGKDITDIIQRFGEVMEEFLLFRSREAKTKDLVEVNDEN